MENENVEGLNTLPENNVVNTTPQSPEVTEVLHTEPIPQQVIEPVNTLPPEEKKKGKLGLIILLIVIALIGGLIGYYFLVFNNTENIYKRAIDGIGNEIIETIDETDKFIKEAELFTKPLMVKSTISASSSDPFLKDLSVASFNINAGMDYKNKEYSANITLNEDNKALINILAYIKDKNVYLQSQKLFYRVVQIEGLTELPDIDLEMENMLTDYKYIVKTFKDAIVKSIDKKYLEKVSETVTVDGKDAKVTKIVLKYNEANAKEMDAKIVEYLLNDNEFLNIILKYAKKTNDSVTLNDIKEVINELKSADKYENFEEGDINLYVSGFTNKLAGFGLKSNNEEFKVLVINEKVKITMNNEEIATGTYKDEKLTLKCEMDETNIEIELDNKKGNLNVKLSDGDENINVISESTNKYNGILTVNATLENINYNVKLNYELLPKTNIEKINTTNAINYNSLTEENMNTIMNNLMNALQNSKLMNMFSTIE